MQLMVGGEEPDFGVLQGDIFVKDGGAINLANLVQPRVEAEIGFVLSRPLRGQASRQPPLGRRSILISSRSRLSIAGSVSGGSDLLIPLLRVAFTPTFSS
jgi:hypothetical protein